MRPRRGFLHFSRRASNSLASLGRVHSMPPRKAGPRVTSARTTAARITGHLPGKERGSVRGAAGGALKEKSRRVAPPAPWIFRSTLLHALVALLPVLLLLVLLLRRSRLGLVGLQDAGDLRLKGRAGLRQADLLQRLGRQVLGVGIAEP